MGLAPSVSSDHVTDVRSSLSPVELLGRLVAFDTTSRNSNLSLADFVCDHLDRPGIRITRNPSADGLKTNLIVQVGPDVDPEERDGVVLSGHMDVVPADEPDWRSDPFVLSMSKDRLIARGACDMKGFLALAVDRIASIEPDTMTAPLALLLTFDEEVGTLGARHFVDTRPADMVLPRRVVIGEPTGFSVVRMHKGHLQLSLTLTGRAAHSGFPQSGVNAIEPMARAVGALADLRRDLESEGETLEHSACFGVVPFVTLNVAQIHGGSATNVVPDRCRLDIGIRLMPGMASNVMIERVRAAVKGVLSERQFELTVVSESPPMLLAEDNELYQTLCGTMGQVDTRSVYFATDAGWLNKADFDCVIFGPGNMDTAHKPNEWISTEELARGKVLVGNIVERYCNQPAGRF
jgi:acetylornithine deacetylase